MSKALVADIWKYGQGVDVSDLMRFVDRFEMYESPAGLVYFDPPVVGDSQFYESYYRRWDVLAALDHRSADRADYRRTARYVGHTDYVIDIGCGSATFRNHVGHAHFTGLDPYATGSDPAIIRKTLEQHAATHAGAYDVATAFHVIEHVANPRRHFELMVELVKPGGLVVLAAPLYPSPLSEIPNFPLNMPPHHVTWWNPAAFEALAREFGMDVVEATVLPPSPHQGQIHWLHRLCMQRTTPLPDDRYYAHDWSWHLSLMAAHVMSKVAMKFSRMPRDPKPVDAYLVARKR